MVGTAGFSSGDARGTTLAMDTATNTPYVAYRDESTSPVGKITVQKYTGSAWELVGTAGFSPGVPSVAAGVMYNLKVALSTAGTPYVAYIGADGKATVMTYTAGTWALVGTAGFSAGGADNLQLALDAASTPYVAYTISGVVIVMKFSAGAWTQVGTGASISGFFSIFLSMALDGGGLPYVAFKDNRFGNQGVVMKYDGTSWAALGGTAVGIGFTPDTFFYTNIVIASTGTLYLAFQDGSRANKVTVLKYDGTRWVAVGTPGFSAGSATYVSLALTSAGTPYVAFKDLYNGGKATVMKFTGAGTTGWDLVGTAGFSTAGADFVSLALTSTGTVTLYVAFRDQTSFSKATVMTFSD